VWSFIGLAGLY
jgi:hypothetical protein